MALDAAGVLGGGLVVVGILGCTVDWHLSHVCIVDALAQRVQQAEQVEQEAAFQALADERWGRIRATGHTVAWDDAKAYLSARAKGEPVDKPTACSALE